MTCRSPAARLLATSGQMSVWAAMTMASACSSAASWRSSPRRSTVSARFRAGSTCPRPEVDPSNRVTRKQLRGVTLQDETAAIQDEGVVGEGQGPPHVLVDEQNRHAVAVDLTKHLTDHAD